MYSSGGLQAYQALPESAGGSSQSADYQRFSKLPEASSGYQGLSSVGNGNGNGDDYHELSLAPL
jgi:hypothetical protein